MTDKIKKRLIIISASVGCLLVLAILVMVHAKPRYVVLVDCDNAEAASQLVEILENAGLDFLVSDDGYQIKINQKQIAEANLILGANDIQASAYIIDNVTSGGFATTEEDKQRRYVAYLENKLAEDIVASDTDIKNARVALYIPEQDEALAEGETETNVSLLLELENEMTSDSLEKIAKAVAVAVGNETTENVVIVDINGNTLF